MPNCTKKHQLVTHTMNLLFNTFHLFFYPFHKSQAGQPAEIPKCIRLWTLLTEFIPPGWILDWVTTRHFQMLGCSHRCTVFSSVHENALWLRKVAPAGPGLGGYDTWHHWQWLFLLLLLIHNNCLTDLFTKLYFYNRTSIIWLLKPHLQFIKKDPILTFSAWAVLSV